jgi:hypothetical protein
MRKIGPLWALSLLLLANCNFFFAYAPDQICETLIRAQCRFAFGCCTAAERLTLLAGLAAFRSEDDCINESLQERGVCLNERAVHDAANQGRFEYDGALAERCVKPFVDAANACDADFVLGDAAPAAADECAVSGFAFGKGKVKAGERCFAAFECADPGSLCEAQPDDPDDDEVLVTAVGTCRAPAKIGEDCGPDGSNGLCEPGSICDFQDQECVALLDNGERCLVDEQCKSDFCDLTRAQPVCNDKLDDGDDCLENDDCKSNLCEQGLCAQPPDVVVEACNGLQDDDTKFP